MKQKKQDIRQVYVSSKIHGKLKKLVGDKAAAGYRASIRNEVETAVENHLRHKTKNAA